MPRKSFDSQTGKCAAKNSFSSEQSPSGQGKCKAGSNGKTPCDGNTAELEDEVENLIAVAKSCCEREKIALQKKHEAELKKMKNHVLAELNKSFEKEFVDPLRGKLQSLEVSRQLFKLYRKIY